MEGFWGCYCHLAWISKFLNPIDLRMFREGIHTCYVLYQLSCNEIRSKCSNMAGLVWFVVFGVLYPETFNSCCGSESENRNLYIEARDRNSSSCIMIYVSAICRRFYEVS